MEVKREVLFVILCVFTLVFCVALPRTTLAAPSNIIRVPQDYPTIQEAVDVANPGDTILVSAGTYNEYVNVSKSLSIIGENVTTTRVWTGTVVFEIHADNVSISNLTIDCGPFGAGVAVYDSHGCNISHNIMHEGWGSIFLQNSSNNVVAHNNIFPYTNGWGVHLFLNSDNNIIRANKVTMALEGIGIGVHYCANNRVEHNMVKDNCYGIVSGDSSNNLIRGNVVESNRKGITLSRGRGNRVYHNNLINNPCAVVDTGENFWDNGAEGNYWSDYNGTDLDGDGIGDTYLPWQGVDYHPLMVPWGPLKTFYVDVNGTTHTVTVLSNSTIASFGFNQSLRHVSFNSTGPPGAQGFCNVTIPKVLLDGHLLVLVDRGLTDFTLTENETHNCVYFAYTFSTRKITIVEYTPIIGDLNYDGRVDLFDVVMVATAYGSREGDPDWNPDADIAPPWGGIDLYDAVTILYHYGEIYHS